MVVKAAIVTRQPEVEAALQRICEQSCDCMVVRSLDRYIVDEELRLAMHACAPEVVFVDVDGGGSAIKTLQAIQDRFPEVQVVAVASTSNHHVLLELMTLGVREMIAYPLPESEFMALMGRIAERLREKPVIWGQTCRVLSFLPAKAGAGTTTLALNVANALSTTPDTKTLLVDLDLNSGLVAFLLQLVPTKGIFEATQTTNELNETLWREFVASKGSLDALVPLELGPSTRIDPMLLQQLLTFVKRLYDIVCFDHSGNLEKLSIEMMKESTHIFLVTTPEIPSLHLARRRMAFLTELDLDKRVSVLLNRSEKKQMITQAAIEKMIGAPVLMDLPNDYLGVQKTALTGACFAPNSELGQQISALSAWLTRREKPRLAAPKKRRFIQYMSSLQGRYLPGTPG